MQWFLEFLGFREPIKVPKLYKTMYRKSLYLIVALLLFTVSLVIVCELFDLYSNTTIGWIVNDVANGVLAALLLILGYTYYVKVCWRRVRAAAKSAGYLYCPTCGHDLRGVYEPGTWVTQGTGHIGDRSIGCIKEVLDALGSFSCGRITVFVGESDAGQRSEHV